MECSSSAGIEGFQHYRPPSQKIDPIQHRRRYDVFLSFRGPDVRNTLANKLFRSLQDEGLHVFLDSERIEKGENIGMSLEEAIQESRVLIPIFSGGYASSEWCLRELLLMWRCKAARAGTYIIPLFYDVEPWHVRYPDNEKSLYYEALKKHSEKKRQSKEGIEEWKEALHQVSSLYGWSLKETASGDEKKLVQKVVEDLRTYNIKDLLVAKHPVGLAVHADEMMKELLGRVDHQRRITIGIWGMGGSGKTTCLKSIFNHIRHMFQACCFVADIRATARESVMGLRNLQKHVLKDLAKHDVDLCSVDQGKIEMKNRLVKIRALVLLDDVDDDEHLDALLGDWYGPGSIIIITTRDKKILQQRQVDKILGMEGLSPEEGVKLFSWNAFARESPLKGYEVMTQQIVQACGGLPLSLEILGAHLRHEMDPKIWREALQKISNVEYDKLYKSLRISYDALSFHEKEIFLDIACFFVVLSSFSHFSKEFYIRFWQVFGRKAVHTYLRNLEAKSLIVMHEYKHTWHGQKAFEFQMHDHLRDLGRQIVEEQSPDNLHLPSRLWHREDIISAVALAEETSTVQGIMCNGSSDFEVAQVDSLASMRNLKFMFCWDLFLEREITKMPQNLSYLVLSKCKVLGSFIFSMPKVVGQLKYLRCLDMSGTHLELLPIEFGELLSLEELYLIGCCLKELPHSFGKLIKLKFLNISDNWLKSLPANFSQLRSLEYLDATKNKFEEVPALPEGLVHFEDFQSFIRYRSGLFSVSGRWELYSTKFTSYRCESLKELPVLPISLTTLTLQKCCNLHRISRMSHMNNLECILLSACPSLVELPELDALHSLTKLTLEGCDTLKELPVLPISLTSLTLEQCYNLQRMSCMSHMKNLECIWLSACPSLVELPELDALHSLTELTLEGCDTLKELPVLPISLTSLTLQKCCNLHRISCMHHMKNLECILLSACPSLVELPELDALHSLTKLTLEGCDTLKELPVLPISLTSLTLQQCYNLQRMSCMSHMKNLECIYLPECLSLGELPELEGLHSLKKLIIYGCEDLKELPVLPISLTSLTIRECYNLRRMSCMHHMTNLQDILLSECPSLNVQVWVNFRNWRYLATA